MSEDFVTIATYNFPQEVYVARAFLESEGVQCRTKDENMAQVHNFLSQAIGGVKLQVSQSDYHRAIDLLREGGYMVEPELPPKLIWLEWIDQFVSRFEIFRHSSQQAKILWFGLLLFLILGTLLGILAYYNYRESDSEYLTESYWILEGVDFGGKYFAPKTVYNPSNSSGVQIIWSYPLEERIKFEKGGKLSIPGFQSPTNKGHWILEGDTIYFSELNDHKEVFESAFYLDRSRTHFELISENTVIYVRKQKERTYLPGL